MKRYLIICLLLVQYIFVQAQTAKITFENTLSKTGEVGFYLPGPPKSSSQLFGDSAEGNYFFKDGIFKQDIHVKELTPIYYYAGKLRGYLYVSPGDDLHVKFSRIGDKDSVTITGKGANNNQYLGLTTSLNREAFKNDTLPDRVLQEIKRIELQNQLAIQQYIKKHKPTKAWKDMMALNQQYIPLDLYVGFNGNQKFSYRNKKNYKELKAIWDKKQDSLLNTVDIQDPKAVQSEVFYHFLSNYLLRKKESLWEQMNDSSVMQKYYPGMTREEALKMHSSDMENQFVERMINQEFQGKVNELAYASLLDNIQRDKKTNAAAIIGRFEKKYPNSEYLKVFAPMISEVRTNEGRKLNDKMIFIPSGSEFSNFDQVLEKVKGKTVLIDLWGSWCGPCHQEIQKNAGPLKKHFADKDVTFMYIANYDEGKDEQLKKLIAYYNMEGLHINANRTLTDDIIKKTGASGFPSYIIIKKDGSYELSKAGYPMKRDVLIKQIEESL